MFINQLDLSTFTRGDNVSSPRMASFYFLNKVCEDGKWPGSPLFLCTQKPSLLSVPLGESNSKKQKASVVGGICPATPKSHSYILASFHGKFTSKCFTR